MSVLHKNIVTLFGQGYGCEAYGETVAYNSCVPTGGESSSSLANTGFAIAVIITIAATIMFAAVLIKVWRRPSKKSEPK